MLHPTHSDEHLLLRRRPHASIVSFLNITGRQLTLEIISEIALGLSPTESQVLPEYVRPCIFVVTCVCTCVGVRICVSCNTSNVLFRGAFHLRCRLFASVMEEMNRRVFEPYRQFFPSNIAHNRVRIVTVFPRLTFAFICLSSFTCCAPSPASLELFSRG